jgi:hypothetical protein
VTIAGAAVGVGPADVGQPNFNAAWGTNSVVADPAGPTSYTIARLTFHRADRTHSILLTFGSVFSVNGGSNAPQPIPSIPGVPEPTALALIGVFSGAMLIRRRRQDSMPKTRAA